MGLFDTNSVSQLAERSALHQDVQLTHALQRRSARDVGTTERRMLTATTGEEMVVSVHWLADSITLTHRLADLHCSPSMRPTCMSPRMARNCLPLQFFVTSTA